MWKQILLFLIINFIGLAIGSYFTADAVQGEWYLSLEKAPWTPPGWVFGAAWTLIMVCFSVYMGAAFKHYQGEQRREVLIIFGTAWFLNVIWNPVFFFLQWTTVALFVIALLALFVIRFWQQAWRDMTWEKFLILPYLLWILLATSLNLYIVLMN